MLIAFWLAAACWRSSLGQKGHQAAENQRERDCSRGDGDRRRDENDLAATERHARDTGRETTTKAQANSRESQGSTVTLDGRS